MRICAIVTKQKESTTHIVEECQMYKEERGVFE